MTDSYNIQTIAKLIGVPKSTLRYWDSEGLIHLNRNIENNYREYSTSTMFEIIDIMSYRMLNMPIKEIRKIEMEPPEKIEITLKEKEKLLNQQIEQLLETKDAILRRQEHFLTYKRVLENPYEECEPPFEVVYCFDYDRKEHWKVCQKDNANFAVVFQEGRKTFQAGIVENRRADQEECSHKNIPCLWSKEKEGERFVQCILRASFENPKENDLSKHITVIRNRYKKETGIVIAQLLFTAYEQKKYDYYLAWVKLGD